MNLYDLLYCLGALVILVTAIARLDDIKRTQNSKRWWVRRVGLLLVTASMMMFIASHFSVGAAYWNEITKLMAIWGWALTWITTPGLPPWWKYITRNDPS